MSDRLRACLNIDALFSHTSPCRKIFVSQGIDDINSGALSSTVVYDILYLVIVIAVVNFILHLIFQALTLNSRTQRLWRSDLELSFNFLTSIPLSSVITISYCIAFIDLGSSRESRWFGTSSLSYTAIILHMATSVYEIGMYSILGKSTEYYAHHISIIIAYFGCTVTGLHHFWGAWVGTIEITNVPLFFVANAEALNIKGTSFYVFWGFMLWLLFTVTRILGLIALQTAHTYDIFFIENSPYSRSSPLVVWSSFAGCSLVMVLSFMWYRKITKGMIKALGIGQKKMSKD